jgi:hypothetical protein
MITTQKSLDIVRDISAKMEGSTFHHHYHILLDIANTYPVEYNLTYLEIGAYAGGSACLMMHRPNTTIISIDLGWPIDPEIVLKNVWNFNKHGNSYSYIKGNSSHIDTISRVKDVKVDILFIDGDHSYYGVWNDFLNYNDLVKPNGYIVFDDYYDHEHSPMVKSAVDHITNQLHNDYEIIGTLKNIHNAKGLEKTNQFSNCFIIKKLDKQRGYNVPIAVNISTYRKDDTTIIKMEKTLDSVFNQTYTNYKIFLIGDDYTKPEEIINLLNKYPTDKIYFKNLDFSRERKYHNDKTTIWRYGGTNSYNHSIDIALDNGFDYVAHLDHDDIWSVDHLQEIVKCIEITGADFICTRAEHITGPHLPLIFTTYEKYVPFMPIYNGIIHSSVCMNFNKIPLRYRDLWLDTGVNNKQTLPADGDMWERCRKYMLKNNLRSFCVNKITVKHETENT